MVNCLLTLIIPLINTRSN